MRIIFKTAVIIGANALGLFLASRFVDGVSLTGDWKSITVIALSLAVLNLIVKPLLKLLLGPLILITLGLASILVNVIILYILDFSFVNLSITGIAPLIYTSLIMSVVNVISHLFTRD